MNMKSFTAEQHCNFQNKSVVAVNYRMMQNIMQHLIVSVSAEHILSQFKPGKRWKHLAQTPRLHFHFLAGSP